MFAKLQPFIIPNIWKHPNETTTKLQWILRVRWMALTFQLFSIFPGMLYGFLRRELILPFISVVFLMGAVNVFSTRLLTRKTPIHPAHLLAQLSLDLIALTALLYMTGGSQNPFTSLLFFHAALGPLLLNRKANRIYFALLVAALTILFFAPAPPVPLLRNSHSVIFVLTKVIIAFVIWQFTSLLTKALSSFRRHVNQLEQHENRMDRLRAVGALTSGFSHEFATPLNVLKLRLARIERRREDSDADLEEDCRVAGEAIRQCETSLRNLLQAQVDPDSYSLRKTEVDHFVRRICESWNLENPDSKILYAPHTEGNYSCLIPQLALTQTILSVLDNARQAEPSTTIKVAVQRDDRWITVSFSDDGPGIPSMVLERLGEPFLSTKKDGTGLGLYNAFNLLEAIDGKLEARNLQPRGAEIRLLFPAEAPA